VFFAELRRQRRTMPPEQCVLLPCADSVVRLPRPMADILSPVLRSVVSGPLAQESKIEYSLKEHSAATVEFALDFCYGDPAKEIDGENAMALLELADELCLEPLRTACSEALVESLVTTNAAQLQETAKRYNAPVLLAAARSITTAASNALGDLMARKLRLQRRLERSTQLQRDEKANENELRKQIRAVEDQRSHEIEELFRRQEQTRRRLRNTPAVEGRRGTPSFPPPHTTITLAAAVGHLGCWLVPAHLPPPTRYKKTDSSRLSLTHPSHPPLPFALVRIATRRRLR
jgi:hypothetical protein